MLKIARNGKKKGNEWTLNLATLLTKRETFLTEIVRLYNNITKFSFNPHCPERSVQRLKIKLTYIFIFAFFLWYLKKVL